ncbi:MAG: type II secretion system GspH family protein [Candidatus Fibromonas sp.]|jgi:prepilin-type N-terminal cleavage/methylation domain-containing protein|nr:type II secretion system GspH family protein [Candidatus Fibromonas sp.]
MIFAINNPVKVPVSARKNAAPAVQVNRLERNIDNFSANKRACAGGFTLLEVMVVVILIGILTSLAYASLMDVIFTSRAKETAQVIRTFAEKSLTDAKRLGVPVRIYIPTSGNYIAADTGTTTKKEFSRMALSGGFIRKDDKPSPISRNADSINAITSELKVGVSGITKEVYFVACDAKGFCGSAGKIKEENSFVARILKPNSNTWEAL